MKYTQKIGIQYLTKDHQLCKTTEKWNDVLQSPLTDEIWDLVGHKARSLQHQDLYWRIAHRRLNVAHRTRHSTNSSACYFCQKDQTLEHFLSQCITAKTIWSLANKILQSYLLTFTPSTLIDDAILTYPTVRPTLCSKDETHVLHIIHSQALWTLWTSHTKAHFEGAKLPLMAISQNFLSAIRDTIETEKARLPNHVFHKRWKTLTQLDITQAL
jgi:hypothetical protein